MEVCTIQMLAVGSSYTSFIYTYNLDFPTQLVATVNEAAPFGIVISSWVLKQPLGSSNSPCLLCEIFPLLVLFWFLVLLGKLVNRTIVVRACFGKRPNWIFFYLVREVSDGLDQAPLL